MEQLALTLAETQELEQCEAIIEHGLRTFVDVGNALLKIRDGRLYRERCKTFEEYCRVQWGFSRMRASQMIAAAEVVENVNHGLQIPLPQSERQARPLTRLEPEQQRDVWAQVVEDAERTDGKITGAKVQGVVDRMRPTMEITQEEMDAIDEEDDRYCSNCRHHDGGSGTDDGWCSICHRIVRWDNVDTWCGLEDWEPEEEAILDQFYETTNARQDVAVTVFSSESNEYYTPPQYIEAAREVMGGIDLDPASCEIAQQAVRASRYYTERDDGLVQEWIGRVWMNPPYGKVGNESSQGYWAQRLIEQHKAGNVTEAVFLVKAAVGYEWFEALWDQLPVCFARDRISFIRVDGNDDGQSKQGTAFFYVGPNVQRFIAVFGQFGRIILPENQL